MTSIAMHHPSDADLQAAFSGHPPSSSPPPPLPYGTAGFRANSAVLLHAMHRCGIFAALRAVKTNQTVGAMVTASHNVEPDNGIKLVDPTGGMLEQSMEPILTEFVNADDAVQGLRRLLEKIEAQPGVANGGGGRVVVGQDTRQSSERLVKAVKDGAQLMGVESIVDLGEVTTPQLHFIVQQCNAAGAEGRRIGESVYFEHFGGAFARFWSLLPPSPSPAPAPSSLYVDAANGVGALKIAPLGEHLSATLSPSPLSLSLLNDGTQPTDQLNEECGAEYVQKMQRLPRGFDAAEMVGKRCCSMDGDADRLVYFSPGGESDHLILCDGDKMAALYCTAIQRMLAEIDLQDKGKGLRVGVVQTAYANGASTAFLDQLPHVDVRCVKTGVKHLHRAAEEYDVGVYFEANGHGTVLVKRERLGEWASVVEGRDERAYERLVAFLGIFNQTTGDALADLLATEAALKYLNMSFADWAALYTELPCRQTKVALPRWVLNRLQPHPEHEKTLTQPTELQASVDTAVSSLIAQHGDGYSARAFIRPSGTEDVCRLYVEATTAEGADRLSDELKAKISQFGAQMAKSVMK
ncbi:unnamed protein product [Vitrella brassicaformis CCMP3155]|uniref:Phosphoacetylglucosamine mutase n=1 Tax=Vitrella brassicaformis (strain CCMP3155) TaxID=1169540 RepID=A0A0G4EXI3_VITBC|nr:unnamed protein product [Vitrella brassicaformis CCMP3155]|eukprot:CEM03411.1 unnamed protein product [Vitrella brassicaformis CCMP3155]